MDENKLKVLEQEYVIFPCCAFCIHADLSPLSDWGTCKVLTYKHNKHNGPDRQLSIHRNGGCERFESGPAVVTLGGYAKFLSD